MCYPLSMNGKNSNLKPQDVVILLKILVKGNESWKIVDLAYELELSTGEISNALERLRTSSLLGQDKKTPLLKNFEEFLLFGLKYVFPASIGVIDRGVLTAHSYGKLSKKIISENTFVWPSADGDERGVSITPLYKNVPVAAMRDPKLHWLLALIDSLRIGKVREQKIAKEELKKALNKYEL